MYLASFRWIEPRMLGKKVTRFIACERKPTLFVRMMSRRDCRYLWCERLWPGTYAVTGAPFQIVSIR